ncbi:hypothetical protein SJAG_02699 [Schizosaccharomyces japonicus yFS275]|uniref:Autophagy-related protein 14 n=1 Tax=Schizosaccharomyces japonicus (strain yFS275 / FY16936) TaxID=402676 RepID=B6K0Y1_SCHJY|nr:hypothetical protein SJAG_02699 [Schizosaccharomyces japonicus yFS275]EEB07602.1 hypothetical protein SJAG_02699 [Schizosaccharomyces japonicus yFS275]
MPQAVICEICASKKGAYCINCIQRQCQKHIRTIKKLNDDQVNVQQSLDRLSREREFILKERAISLKKKELEELEDSLRDLRFRVSTLHLRVSQRKQKLKNELDGVAERKQELKTSSQISLSNIDQSSYQRQLYVETLGTRLLRIRQHVCRKVLDMFQLKWNLDLKSQKRGSDEFLETSTTTLSAITDGLANTHLSSSIERVSLDSSGSPEHFLSLGVSVAGVPVVLQEHDSLVVNPDAVLVLSFLCVLLAHYMHTVLPCSLHLPHPGDRQQKWSSEAQSYAVSYNIAYLAWFSGAWILSVDAEEVQALQTMQNLGYLLVQLRIQPFSYTNGSSRCFPIDQSTFFQYISNSLSHTATR